MKAVLLQQNTAWNYPEGWRIADKSVALSHLMLFVLAAYAGLFLCIAFESDMILPLPVTLVLFSAVCLLGIGYVRLSRFSLLTRAVLLVYSLPFIHVFEYLWIDDLSSREILWGLAANDYNRDINIVKRMIMAGTIGAIGLVLGFMTLKLVSKPAASSGNSPHSLSLGAFSLIAFLGLVFSWLYAPEDTIVTAAYTESISLLTGSGINFNAGWLVSYIFVALMFIDAFAEKDPRARKIKFRMTAVVVLTVVIWFQLMRGDRECIGLVAALIALYLLNKAPRMDFRKLLGLAVLVAVVFVSAQVVGNIRSIALNKGFTALEQTTISMKAGTWSAALLTPLSVIGDFHHNKMQPRWGETYRDLLLSIPPGVMSQMAGIERPIEATHGPAWEMRYGIGGTHAMVVPFMNFKSFGVLFVLMAYGVFVASVERRVGVSKGVKNQLLYASLLIITPFWFWYGEMNLIRALMAFYIVLWIYRLLPKMDKKALA